MDSNELRKEFEHKYPTIFGSDRNISYTYFLEEKIADLQQQINKNELLAVVSKQRELLIAIFNKLTGEDIDCLLAEKFEEVANRRLRNL